MLSQLGARVAGRWEGERMMMGAELEQKRRKGRDDKGRVSLLNVAIDWRDAGVTRTKIPVCLCLWCGVDGWWRCVKREVCTVSEVGQPSDKMPCDDTSGRGAGAGKKLRFFWQGSRRGRRHAVAQQVHVSRRLLTLGELRQ